MAVKLKRGQSWKNKVKIDLTELNMLQKRLVDFGTKKIRWGYFDKTYEGDSPSDKRHGLPVAVIAMWHEYRQAAGQGGYKKRPFFTQSISKAEVLIPKVVPFLFGQELLGRVKNTKGGVENAFQHRLRAFALNLCKTVQQEIDAGNFTELRPRTIAEKRRKGYPLDILIETGQLRNKLQWMVISPKAYGKNKVVIGNVSDDVKEPIAKDATKGRKTRS